MTWVFACLVIFFLFEGACANCWTSGAYHESAWLLINGIGGIDSDAVCVYGHDASLNEECPLPCSSLLKMVWGDCYCRNPKYVPTQTGSIDPQVRDKGIFQVYTFISTSSVVAPGATCRNWLNETENRHSWTCVDGF